MVKVKLLSPDSKLPIRTNPTDAGADVFSIENVIIPPQGRYFVDTGIAIQAEIPPEPTHDLLVGHLNSMGATALPLSNKSKSYIRIAPRSGLAFKSGIHVLAGVVDLGFTGTVKVGLYNSSNTDFEVTKGMKIAQIIREVCIIDDFVEVDELESTDRGLKGWGSSDEKSS